MAKVIVPVRLQSHARERLHQEATDRHVVEVLRLQKGSADISNEDFVGIVQRCGASSVFLSRRRWPAAVVIFRGDRGGYARHGILDQSPFRSQP